MLLAVLLNARPIIAEPTLAERLCSGFERIESLQCEIEKTSVAGGKTVRMISRVDYRRPRHLHVSITEPTERRVIMDGMTLYYHEAGAPYGFSRPIDDLAGPWADSARNIPATPMEHLLKLRARPETPLDPGEDGATRAGYAGKGRFAVLSADADGRLLRIAFYASPAMEELTGEYRYADFVAAGPGCWIPRLHEGALSLPGGESIRETRVVGNLRVNEPVSDTRFDASCFFSNVTFVADFRRTYEGSEAENREKQDRD